MGYIKHTTLIVTCWDKKHLTETRKKLIELFKLTFKDEPDKINECTQIITKIHRGLANLQYSFAVLPDGSKEGWPTSDKVENAIDKLLFWLKENKKNNYCEYIYATFSGDDSDYTIKTDKCYE